MESNKFALVAASERSPKWDNLIARNVGLYHRADDIRSEFMRDYNRILHCNAYRRLKHKTQVFFATRNDHICTRIEHVNHVAAVSHTISKYLGLNTELTSAIAIGHDLGHAPFGHEGETILKNLAKKYLTDTFWHEKNSLWFVDMFETLPSPDGHEQNLNLTYAVRDGIVCHCGEVNENAVFPRDEFINLSDIEKPSQFSPYSWEGCIVKISDKISYLGRDIEDALTLKILTPFQLKELKCILKNTVGFDLSMREINNTVLMHDFIINLCECSSPDVGIKFSENYLNLINSVKEFNYNNIYYHPRLQPFKDYAQLIIECIFNTLKEFYKGNETLDNLKRCEKIFPLLINTFSEWLIKYTEVDLIQKRKNKLKNNVVFSITDSDEYIRSILSFISGMTDSFAIRIFMELTTF